MKILNRFLFNLPFDRIVSNRDEIDTRLRSRVTVSETIGLLVACSFLASYLWMITNGIDVPGDYLIYTRAAAGDTDGYYYAYWMIPFFQLLGWLPGVVGYLLWSLLSILCVFFAARIFGGRAELVLISYQYLALLYFGQITGLLLGGMALFWWAIQHRHGWLAGLGLLIACTKFQVGLPMGLTLFLFCKQPWKIRLRSVFLPAVGIVISLFLYPNWPITLLAHIQSVPPDSSGSITPWRYFGPVVLLCWLPPLLAPIKREYRIATLIAATALGLPYFQQADLICLYAFPFGWLPITGLLGLTFKTLDWPDYRFLTIIPVLMYLFALLAPWVRRFRSISDSSPSQSRSSTC